MQKRMPPSNDYLFKIFLMDKIRNASLEIQMFIFSTSYYVPSWWNMWHQVFNVE